MARMLQALKNLEAKDTRAPLNSTPPRAATSAAGTKLASLAVPSQPGPSAGPVAPRVIDVVDKLNAVVGRELSGYPDDLSASGIAPAPDFAFTDFAYVGQWKSGEPVFPPRSASPIASQPMPTVPQPAARPACELERRVKRAISDPVHCRPIVDLIERLLRDMEQSESKALAFVGLGTSEDLHTAALHAATLLAENRSKKVLLIDGDLARRSLTVGLEYGDVPGFSEILRGTSEMNDALQPTAVSGLSFLAAGQSSLVPASDAAESLEKLLGWVKGNFDCVLIVAGDAGGSSAPALASGSDATYLVVELGAVEMNAAQAALAQLRAAGARVLGCIAT
jgi:Mrp family chromosome partitioning ATPase